MQWAASVAAWWQPGLLNSSCCFCPIQGLMPCAGVLVSPHFITLMAWWLRATGTGLEQILSTVTAVQPTEPAVG